MRALVGLIGLPLAGKGTVVEILIGIAKEAGASLCHYKSRSILEDTAERWHIEKNRPNLQKVVKGMEWEGAFGEGTLTRAMRMDLEESGSDVLIFDAVRMPTDEPMMRDLGGLILSITADEKTRYDRAKKRRREGEAELTLEEFRTQETASTEIHIPDMASRADWTIDNNGNADDLRLEVEKFWIEKIDPLLKAFRSNSGQARE